MNRSQIIDHYRQQPEISVLIVGAGINGIGTFRDLALQGVDVLMVDKADFCAASSAASSRQAHGGLRYLEHGDFRLVRESLAERNRLLRNAPHAVEPLPTTIPVFHWFSGLLNAPLKFLGLLKKPNERGYLVVKIGMMFYDWFTRNDRMMPTHKMLNREQAFKKHTALNPDVIGAATYYDCLMPQAERIGLELALDAEAANADAHALNYCTLIGGDGESVELRDELTGETFRVKPRLVINAGGAWIDFVNGSLQRKTHFIGGTKGSHIVVDHPELVRVLDGSVIYFENTDGRTAIFMPFYDKAIIGATDIYVDDPEGMVCSDEEIDYFLKFSDHVLPSIKVDRSHIVFHFSGVRPLPHTDVEFAGLVTREHSIREVAPDESLRYPIYSLVGGKWTTFRAFAEQTTDKALAYLQRARRTGTHDIAIGGGAGYPHTPPEREAWLAQTSSATGVPLDRLTALFERYGTRAEAVARYIAAGDDRSLAGLPSYSRRETMFIAEHEKIAHLDDIVIRRTVIGLCGLVNSTSLRALAEAAAEVTDWSAEQTEQEITRAADILIREHGVPAARLAGVAAKVS
ncbi:MAG: glycerol-3-phosphate dehydrogenase/oxidase [Anaerolineae bacterium]|nr:glycerol-3-phosphate dehydrogenase/oxidase [Anaerolineae bacterium]